MRVAVNIRSDSHGFPAKFENVLDCIRWLQIVLRMTDFGKVRRVVYTAYPDGGGRKLNCYIKLNGATSITTNQELGFSIQSTPSGNILHVFLCCMLLY